MSTIAAKSRIPAIHHRFLAGKADDRVRTRFSCSFGDVGLIAASRLVMIALVDGMLKTGEKVQELKGVSIEKHSMMQQRRKSF